MTHSTKRIIFRGATHIMTRSRIVPSAIASLGVLLVGLASSVPLACAETGGHDQHQSEQNDPAPMPHDNVSASGTEMKERVMDAGGSMRCGGAGHEHHKAMMTKKGYKRSVHDYALPDIELVDMDGRKTTLLTELSGTKPVIVTFVFTTCTTICPVLSGTFAQLQTELGPDVDDVQMISVSIDPEYDTPERLRAYAGLFKAGPQWQFLTGKVANIIAVQKSFGVYRGNKMNHEPTILLHKSKDSPWIRMEGLASAAEVADEYRRMMEGEEE
jgi:protein SCO1